MPKSSKAAPPQQANLSEMWGKKNVPKTVAPKVEPKLEPKLELDAMQVDVPAEKKGI